MRRPKAGGAAGDLASALAQVKADYLDFLRAADDEVDAKAFGAKHAAAKTALSHIEQLMKLSGDVGGETARRLAEYHALLGDIRRDMSAEPEEETRADDDGDSG